jgi:hypothetical protein
MNAISGAVYDPPSDGLPWLTIVFGGNGEPIVARRMNSRQEAETLLAEIKATIEAAIGQELGDQG